jgi:MFS family permease
MIRSSRTDLYPWAVAALMGCCYAVAFVDRALVNVASTPIKHDMALSDSQFGLLSGTAFGLLFVFCGVPLGWLADRTDRRAMIALAILFWTAMTVVCGLAGSFPVFFAARIGVGFGEACLVPAGMSLLGSIVAPGKMARSVALFLMGSAIGNVTALLGGGYLLTRLSRAGPIGLPLLGVLAPWQILFLVTCPAGILVAGLVMLIREPRRDGPVPAGLAPLRAAAAHIGAHRRAYGFLTAATCCTVALSQAQAAWMPLFYVRRFGLEPGASAVLVGWMFLVSVPTGQIVGGMLTDRLHARQVPGAPNLVIALCATLALPPAILFCTADRLWISEAAYIVFNFLVAAATPNGLAGLQLLTPRRHQGIASALLVSIASVIGIGIGPAAIGLLTDHVFHDEQALGLSLLAVILAAGLAAPVLALGGRRSFAHAVGRVQLMAAE